MVRIRSLCLCEKSRCNRDDEAIPSLFVFATPDKSGRGHLGGAVWTLGIFRFGHPDALAFRHLDFGLDLAFELRHLSL